MKLIFSPSRSPSFNLAAEEFLFSESGDEIVFLYVNDPCVIIGSNQSVPNEVDQDFCVLNSIEIIRRLSGGGAVYHDQGNINYCFIHNKIPDKSSLSADFLMPVIQSLHSMQIPCEIGKRKDLWLNGYKISGTASHVSKNRELHHGTLLYNTDLGKLQNALTPQVGKPLKKATLSVPSPVKNIRTFLMENDRYTPAESVFFQLFSQKILDYFQLNQLSEFTVNENAQIDKMQLQKYSSNEWNFKM